MRVAASCFRRIVSHALLVIALLILGEVALMAQAAKRSQSDSGSVWDVVIAIPESNDERAISLDVKAHFHVILTNKSAAPQKMWKESNSWGYSAIQFEMTDEADKKSVIMKKERAWRKNTPSFWLIGSGEILVYDVYLGSGEWMDVPSGMRDKRVKLRAIVKVTDEEKAQEYGVWTGEVRSPILDAVLR
jgi:hypothetical protein